MMLFSKQLMDKVLSGEKTVTRRLGENSRYSIGKTYTATDRSRWAKKGTPYRTAKIVIEWVSQVRLGEIDDVDAVLEGFNNRDEFFRYWTQHLRFPWDEEQKIWRISFKLKEVLKDG